MSGMSEAELSCGVGAVRTMLTAGRRLRRAGEAVSSATSRSARRALLDNGRPRQKVRGQVRRRASAAGAWERPRRVLTYFQSGMR